MRFLIDTNAFLWFVEGSNRLSEAARDHIEDTRNDLSMSIATLWEMAIKISLGKLEISLPLDQFIRKQLELSGIALLPVNEHHAYAIAGLPLHHRDPFDRMLVAQCLTEGLAVISPDGAFDS